MQISSTYRHLRYGDDGTAGEYPNLAPVPRGRHANGSDTVPKDAGYKRGEIVFVSEDGLGTPPPLGYHRIVATYDNLKPIGWKDVPDTMEDPIPLYLSTSAARIYMMSDEEYAAYERQEKHKQHEEQQVARHQKRVAMKYDGHNGFRDIAGYAKIIGVDIALGVAAVVLFSPGLLGLSPADPNILMASVAVTSGVALAGTAIATNARLLAPPKQATPLPIGPGVAGTTHELSLSEVRLALEEYSDIPVVSPYAIDGIRQADETERKRQRIMALISGKFEPRSLSWQRFMGVLDSAVSTVTTNVALIANKAQAFDADGYHETKSLIESGAYRWDDIPDDIQQDRYGLYQDLLKSMQEILNNNERLLLEIDRFEVELGGLDASMATTDSDEMLDEVKRAISAIHQYAD